MNAAVAGMSPAARRTLLTICTMTATIMQALDTTIANVALPYMQGSLSASLDQVNWVLTSYIVASAVMTAPIGWLSNRYGRKKLFVICVAGFTVASAVAAAAPGYWFFAVSLVPVGLTALTAITTANAMVQTRVAPEMRGRVMALYMAIFMGGTPVGAPMIGWVSEVLGPRWTIGVGSVAVALSLGAAALWLARAENVRVSYESQRRPRLAVSSSPVPAADRPTVPLPEPAR